MFNLFGLRRDSKKSSSDKEADGGFVFVGETADEQKQRIQTTMKTGQHSTNVIVQPAKSPCPTSFQPAKENPPKAVLHVELPGGHPAAEMTSALPDLLGDVPFTLAPHVLAMQAGSNMVPDVLLTRDINCNLSSFHYDFTLENSVLHNS